MRICWVLIICILLQACTDVAVTGAQAVYNRHSLQKKFNDQYTTFQAYQALKKDKKLYQESNIAITTYQNEVLLAGQVPSVWQRYRAERLVKQVPDIGEIHNVITIANPSSSLTRMSDAWITAKVKSKLIASEDLDASQIKVVTENGTVYLMGTIMSSEAEAAEDIAKDTDGVSHVVRIFKYVHISRKPEGRDCRSLDSRSL